jgi:N-acetylneuraminic acid mutarotase
MTAITRRAGVFLFTATGLVILLVCTANFASAESLGTWAPTGLYPDQLAGAGCVAVSAVVYCVGGFDTNYNSYDDVNYAALNSSGVGTWTAGTSYPTAVDSASCVSVNSTIYCVGGEEDDGAVVLDNVYYTQVSPASGLSGSWSAGATYPQPTAATSCVVFAGYIYCVGGFDSNGDEVSSSYYGQLTASGIESWSSTTAYPKAVDSESCVASGGYIFCVAGEVESGGNPNNPINNVYYAPLNSSGIGKWSSGPAYPASLAALSCVAYSGYVYCVGGFDSNLLSGTGAYYAPISSSGVGSWTSTTSYPVPIDTSPCVVSGTYLYCIGGESESSSSSSTQTTVNYVYFVNLGGSTSSTISSTAPEFPLAGALPLTLAVVLGAASAVLGLRGRKATRA